MKILSFLLITLTLISAPTLVTAATTNIPATGQTTCYDSDGVVIDCDGTGQDGDIQAGVSWPDPRFTDNGDGTVTDELTGLMWLKDFNCANTAGYDPSESGDGSMTWQQALDFAIGINNSTINISSCTTSSHTDWRVPNQKEAESILDMTQTSPPLASGHLFENAASLWYWTSNTYKSGGMYHFAQTLRLLYGGITFMLKATPSYPTRTILVRGNSDTTYKYAIPATGQINCYDELGDLIDCTGTGQDGESQLGVEWPEPRFTDNSDGTIIDNLTGLMWLKDANCMVTNYPSFDEDYTSGDGEVTWQHALDFINGINNGTYSDCMAGYSDWRLPTYIETTSLSNLSTAYATWLNSFGFENIETGRYWSSTTAPDSSIYDEAATSHPITGSISEIEKTHATVGRYVWQVRDGIPNIKLSNGPATINDTSTIDFGEITVGENSTFSITGTNIGSRGDLSFEQIAFSGTDSDQFSLSVDNCSNYSFEPSETCEFTISFEPTTEGEKSTTISIPSNDHFDSSIDITLSGTGTEELVPNIVVTDEAAPVDDHLIGFGEVNVGTSSETTTITISNDGTADLELGAVGFAGNNIAHFDVENNTCFNTTLAPGEDCLADIYFHPLVTGNIGAIFLIESNDPDSPETEVIVAGTGIAAEEEETEETDTETDNDTEEETTDGTDEDNNDNTANPGNTEVGGSSTPSSGGCSLSHSNAVHSSTSIILFVLFGLFLLTRRRCVTLK